MATRWMTVSTGGGGASVIACSDTDCAGMFWSETGAAATGKGSDGSEASATGPVAGEADRCATGGTNGAEAALAVPTEAGNESGSEKSAEGGGGGM